MMRRLLLVLLLLAPNPVCAEERVAFDAAEVRQILAHGPWPRPAKRDPSNRFSGQPAAIAFGRTLFFDEGLSRFGALSCASCHKPDKAWGDGRARASAAASLDRNTPALFNLRHMTWFGWDGGADSLWMQSIRPILDPREMAASPEHVQQHIASSPALRAAYRRLTSGPPAKHASNHVLVNVAKALAAFQETLTTGRTPFDDFRDALAKDDAAAMAAYPLAARRGLKLFVGRGQCSSCHAGAMFTNNEFHDTGLDTTNNLGRADNGRQGGIEKLRASPFNRSSRYSDETPRPGLKRLYALSAATTVGAFRVPSLRSVALTAPYMHDGSKPTLVDAITHYSEPHYNEPAAPRPPRLRFDLPSRIALTPTEIADIAAFLETLTEIPAR
ncbi:MAG: cytochrome-c peroxidase [Hyphomicrobiaceae bacterium]